MDLIKELEKMEKGNLSLHEIRQEIEEQQLQLEKKAYIFKVLSIAKDVEDYIKTESFPSKDIAGIELDSYESENEVSIAFSFFRNDGETIYHDLMKKEYPEILQRFREIFNGPAFANLKDLSVKNEFLNKEFVQSGSQEFDLNEGVGEEIIDVLLSKELKSMLDYSKMQLSLDNKSEKNKKLKV